MTATILEFRPATRRFIRLRGTADVTILPTRDDRVAFERAYDPYRTACYWVGRRAAEESIQTVPLPWDDDTYEELVGVMHDALSDYLSGHGLNARLIDDARAIAEEAFVQVVVSNMGEHAR